MSAVDTDAPSSSIESSDSIGSSAWGLEWIIGIGVVVLGLCAWGFTHFGGDKPGQDKPKPTWLAISKVMAQMSDGRMVNIKVNLRLANDKAVDQLEPHLPAFKALIQETGTKVSKDDLQGAQGMKNFSQAIRESLNDYLQDQQVSARVKDVAFEEMMLMP